VKKKRRSKNGIFIIGLLGGIGSGKSAAAKILEKKGGARIDCDALVHELYRDEAVADEIAAEFGDAVRGPDGVDRTALADAAFASEKAVKKLMAIVHPKVVRETRRRLAELEKRGVRFAVIEAAFLVEAGLDKLCDSVWFVDADDKSRNERVMRGRGWSPDEAARREKFQMPLAEKRAAADRIIENRSSLGDLEARMDRILKDELKGYTQPATK